MSAPASPPRILLAHGERIARETLARDLAREGYKVRSTADLDTLWRWTRSGEGELVLIDVDIADPARNGFELLRQIRQKFPHLPVLILSAHNPVLTSLLAARFGANDYFAKPYSFAQLAASIGRALQSQESGETVSGPHLPLIGDSAPMQAVYRRIAKAAQVDLPVLLSGETGTGKSLAANVIHDYGSRAEAAFAVLHFPLADAGFDRALTEAAEAAGPGTLVLENISAMSQAQQAHILAMLERRDTAHGPRLMATTRAGDAGGVIPGVSPDLLYRLNTIPIPMPPLRQRGQDCVALAQAFAGEFGKGRKSISAAALRALAGRPWPGNVHELRTAVQRAVLLSPGDVIDTSDLFPAPPHAQTMPSQNAGLDDAMVRAVALWLDETNPENLPHGLYDMALAALERPLLRQVMALCAGNQLKAAAHLGINRNTLRKKLVHHGLLGT